MTETTEHVSAQRPITIDMPGSFDAYFEGSSVAQGVYDEPAAEQLGTAYSDAEHLKRGKGYTLRMTMTVEAAWLLLAHTQNPTADGDYTPGEISGARITRERLQEALKAHYTARFPTRSPITTPAGAATVVEVSLSPDYAFVLARIDSGEAMLRYREDEIQAVTA